MNCSGRQLPVSMDKQNAVLSFFYVSWCFLPYEAHCQKMRTTYRPLRLPLPQYNPVSGRNYIFPEPDKWYRILLSSHAFSPFTFSVSASVMARAGVEPDYQNLLCYFGEGYCSGKNWLPAAGLPVPYACPVRASLCGCPLVFLLFVFFSLFQPFVIQGNKRVRYSFLPFFCKFNGTCIFLFCHKTPSFVKICKYWLWFCQD